MPIFVTALVVALWRLSHLFGIQPRNRWLLGPLFFFAFMAFTRDNAFLTFMNVTAVLTLSSYLAFFFAIGRVVALEVITAFLIPIRVGWHSLYQATPLITASVDVSQVRLQGQRNLFPLLRGGLLAFPILLVFTLLLASADLIFAEYLQAIFSLRLLPEVADRVWQICLIIMVAWLLAGGFVYALECRQTANDNRSLLEQALDRIRQVSPLGFIESLTILTTVNFLFLTFVAVQFAYLFGSNRNISIDGYTFAEYARQGFFELVTTAVLSLTLVLGLNWITRRDSKRHIHLFNALSSLLIGFVLIMLVSAFHRMRLYEQTFGYTELRLYVYVFMIWLGALLVWFTLTLWRRPDRFAIGLVIAMIGFLATLNLINPDAFIVRQNMVRYEQTNDLDTHYLLRLSDDAVPELVTAWGLTLGDPQLMTSPMCMQSWDGRRDYTAYEQECQMTLSEILREDLAFRLQLKNDSDKQNSWQSFHLSRWLAHRQLLQMIEG